MVLVYLISSRQTSFKHTYCTCLCIFSCGNTADGCPDWHCTRQSSVTWQIVSLQTAFIIFSASQRCSQCAEDSQQFLCLQAPSATLHEPDCEGHKQVRQGLGSCPCSPDPVRAETEAHAQRTPDEWILHSVEQFPDDSAKCGGERESFREKGSSSIWTWGKKKPITTFGVRIQANVSLLVKSVCRGQHRGTIFFQDPFVDERRSDDILTLDR